MQIQTFKTTLQSQKNSTASCYLYSTDQHKVVYAKTNNLTKKTMPHLLL